MIWLVNDWEYIAYWDETKQREVLPNKFGLPQIVTLSVKLLTQNFCFCFKIKIKQTQAAQIRNIHVVFKHIHQNIRAYPRSKKMTNDLIGQWLGKYCILGWNWAKRGAAKQVWFVPNTVRQSGVSRNTRKILQFFPSFKLGNSSSST